jgi:ribosomal protein S18 acetylase RimI-like enzyme
MTHPGCIAIVDRPGSFGRVHLWPEEDGTVAGQSEITFQLLDGAQAGVHASELEALRTGECGEDGSFGSRFRVLRRQPGFVLAEARHGGYLVGYAFGMPLRPSTSWWRQLTTPLPDETTAEHPGRTFALVELLVRASWRRQGIAGTLHDRILADRSEERATLIVRPAATPAQRAFRKWGWRKVARTRDAEPGSPVSDVLVITLRQDIPARLPKGRHAASG